MKSKERHELHQNELAAWLTDFTHRVRPYVWHIVGAVVIIILAILLINMQRDSRRRESIAGYQAMTSALNPAIGDEQMRPAEVTELRLAAIDQFLEGRHGDGPYASLVRLSKAELLYERSMLGWGQRESADRLVPRLEEARNLFRDIRQEQNVALHPQAAFGQACSVRLLGHLRSDPDLLQQGRELLETVARDYPDNPMGEAAAERLRTIAEFRPLTLSPTPLDDPFGGLGLDITPRDPQPAPDVEQQPPAAAEGETPQLDAVQPETQTESESLEPEN